MEYDNARTALVDGHVGCTAGKAAKVLTKAVGGVLFLDEAYTLVPGTGGHDYSQEAIDVLLAKLAFWEVRRGLKFSSCATCSIRHFRLRYKNKRRPTLTKR